MFDPCPPAPRDRPEPPALTPERILQLAARPEGFRVSWRWRDEWLLRRCMRMVKAGKLRRIKRHEKGAYFFGLPLPEPHRPVPSVAETTSSSGPWRTTRSPVQLVFDEDLFG